MNAEQKFEIRDQGELSYVVYLGEECVTEFSDKSDAQEYVKWFAGIMEAYAASETAEKKLLRDAINQQLAQLRDWANDAERRCKAETARADQLADWKESAMNVMNQINLQAIGEELGLPLGSEISSAILPAIKCLKAAEERADRAERAQRWIPIEDSRPDRNIQALVLCTAGDYTHVELEWYNKGGYYDSGFYHDGEMDTNVTHWMPLPLSPIPSPAKPK